MAAIENWLMKFSDQRLADLYAHTEDGKLSYRSCDCLVGAINAPHALRANGFLSDDHLRTARGIDGAADAEWAFKNLGGRDKERRRLLLPMIRAEMDRRDMGGTFPADTVELGKTEYAQ